ncbi:hypothetical protein CIRG_00133 [Coccidioides immitis RMSCC 2394]|uniref:Uncharacterized protein n=1 Tax=Coccidioides immitis RMSCC 2394 TaxID=404692 RepID=A0A0J6XV05_COCIT|nr:hypothetical protein CIRG_00133 [Coccidioides immitis RMSCC 2394]
MALGKAPGSEKWVIIIIIIVVHYSPMQSVTLKTMREMVVFNLPTTRTLLLSPNHTIDPPSPELLALHQAIALILDVSAAGQYIDHIIHHIEELWARSDGSSDLGAHCFLEVGCPQPFDVTAGKEYVSLGKSD